MTQYLYKTFILECQRKIKSATDEKTLQEPAAKIFFNAKIIHSFLTQSVQKGG